MPVGASVTVNRSSLWQITWLPDQPQTGFAAGFGRGVRVAGSTEVRAAAGSGKDRTAARAITAMAPRGRSEGALKRSIDGLLGEAWGVGPGSGRGALPRLRGAALLVEDRVEDPIGV